MIGRLRGELVSKHPPHLLVDVQGLGYEVEAPMSTFYQLPQPGEPVVLLTHLVVREDAHTLYGFGTEAERSLFRELIKVSGVGAKMALAILSGMSSEAFSACVEASDTAALVRLPGVGKKTAERLIVEMRDRLARLGITKGVAGSAGTAAGMVAESPVAEAVSALIALGYKPNDASAMVRAVASDGLTSEEIIRAALKSVAEKR